MPSCVALARIEGDIGGYIGYQFIARIANNISILNHNVGGDGGIRTLDRPLQAYNGLANRRLQPLGHVSSNAGYA